MRTWEGMLDKRKFCGFCGDSTRSSSLSILFHVRESWVDSSALSTAVRTGLIAVPCRLMNSGD